MTSNQSVRYCLHFRMLRCHSRRTVSFTSLRDVLVATTLSVAGSTTAGCTATCQTATIVPRLRTSAGSTEEASCTPSRTATPLHRMFFAGLMMMVSAARCPSVPSRRISVHKSTFKRVGRRWIWRSCDEEHDLVRFNGAHETQKNSYAHPVRETTL